MKVPFLGLATNDEELVSVCRGVLERGHFVLGPEVAAFEKEWAAYCERKEAVGVASGLDALRLILQACGIGPGDEILVPANTCIATWMAVSAVGAVPVPVDAWMDMNIDPVHAEARVTPRTRAIIAVHLYGRAANIAALRDVADRHGLKLIVDAAQGHGLKGNLLGDAAAFSFYPTKNLGAFGDGGAVVTDDPAIAQTVRQLRNYGSVRKDEHALLGSNSRLDELQAAVLRVKLRRLDAENEKRLVNALFYNRAFLGLGNLLEAGPGDSVWHLYVVRSRERDQLRAGLARRGVETMIHYPTPSHLQQCYEHLGYERGDFPEAEVMAEEILSLPITASVEATKYVAVAVEEVCALLS